MPDLVVGEIIGGELVAAIYAREQAAHPWLIDPIEKTLEVLRREQHVWVIAGVYAGNDEVRAEPVDATTLALARLWVD